jgi:hypothetical protein
MSHDLLPVTTPRKLTRVGLDSVTVLYAEAGKRAAEAADANQGTRPRPMCWTTDGGAINSSLNDSPFSRPPCTAPRRVSCSHDEARLS